MTVSVCPRAAFVAAARALLGVRWRHQGRTAWAVDCLGLIVLAMRATGRAVSDRDGYGRDPQRDGLREGLRAQLGEPGGWAHGGIVLIQWAGAEHPSHVGILALGDGGDEWRLIHSYSSPGCVVEHRVDEYWRGIIVEAYDPWRRP